MKMEKRILVIAAIGAVVALMVAAGVGYSLNYGRTYSEDNTMDVETDFIDVYVSDGVNFVPQDSPIFMPDYSQGVTKTLAGYRIVTSGPGDVTLVCHMENDACWALIKSMSIEIGGGHYPFGIGKIADVTTTGLPSDPITLTMEGHTFESGGKTLVYYDFTITIEFADVDITSDPNWGELSTFTGSWFEFVFEPA